MTQWFRRALALSLVGAGLSACGGQEREFSRTRTKTLNSRDRAISVPDRYRFGFGDEEEQPGEREVQSTIRSNFEWKTPDTWVELEPAPLRDINFSVADHPEADCYLSFLPSNRGSLLDNLNRWRGQIGYSETMDQQAVDNLPTRPLLGRPAAYVELEGTFEPRGATEGKPDWMLVGLMQEVPGLGSFFVKMTGPRDLVRQELPHFDEFCRSLDVPFDHATPGGNDRAAPVPGSSLAWDVPDGWEAQPLASGSMRLVSFFAAGGSPDTHCWVTVLGGQSGSLGDNLQRWAGEMGVRLSPEEIAAMPTLEVLGRDATFLKIDGDYVDSMGRRQVETATMLGLICPFGASTIFVKLVGPAAEVAGETERFREFCRSLRQAS